MKISMKLRTGQHFYYSDFFCTILLLQHIIHGQNQPIETDDELSHNIFKEGHMQFNEVNQLDVLL